MNIADLYVGLPQTYPHPTVLSGQSMTPALPYPVVRWCRVDRQLPLVRELSLKVRRGRTATCRTSVRQGGRVMHSQLDRFPDHGKNLLC